MTTEPGDRPTYINNARVLLRNTEQDLAAALHLLQMADAPVLADQCAAIRKLVRDLLGRYDTLIDNPAGG